LRGLMGLDMIGIRGGNCYGRQSPFALTGVSLFDFSYDLVYINQSIIPTEKSLCIGIR